MSRLMKRTAPMLAFVVMLLQPSAAFAHEERVVGPDDGA